MEILRGWRRADSFSRIPWIVTHPKRARRTQNLFRLFPALALIAGILMAPTSVLAVGTWQWTAKLDGTNTVLGPFTTKEQAVQALQAAAVQSCATAGYPCPAESTALQWDRDLAVTPNSKTYHYGAVIPSTPTAYSCYVWTSNPVPPIYHLTWGTSACFLDEASLVAAATSMPGCYKTQNSDGSWNVFVNS